jgi:hypothetical protein
MEHGDARCSVISAILQAMAGGFIVAPNDKRRANKASQISNIL